LVLVGIILMFLAVLDILGFSFLAVQPMLLLLGAIGCFLIAVVLLLQQVAAALDRLHRDLSRRQEEPVSSGRWG